MLFFFYFRIVKCNNIVVVKIGKTQDFERIAKCTPKGYKKKNIM